MLTDSVEVYGMGKQRLRFPIEPSGSARLEIYIDLWDNEGVNIIAAMSTARDELSVDIDIEQVEGMTCVNVEGFPNHVSLFHSRLLNEGVNISTTKSR